jgi:GNAT superfamily N-acetyltransferase
MVDEATEVLMSAFQKEALTTALLLDLSQKRHRGLYSKTVKLELDLYLRTEQPVFVAVEDGKVIGIAIIKTPHAKGNLLLSARIILPYLSRLIFLAPTLVRAIRLAPVIKKPKGLPKPHYIIEAVAVDPKHQGKKVGRLLLEHSHSYCMSDKDSRGIHITTGDEKNRNIYERFGYQMLEQRRTGDFTSYHMFLENNISECISGSAGIPGISGRRTWFQLRLL